MPALGLTSTCNSRLLRQEWKIQTERALAGPCIVFFDVRFFFLFLISVYLETQSYWERERQREKELFHLLVHSQMAGTSSAGPGQCQEFIQVVLVGGERRKLILVTRGHWRRQAPGGCGVAWQPGTGPCVWEAGSRNETVGPWDPVLASINVPAGWLITPHLGSLD